MKTLTEFSGLNIKNAAKTRQDILAGGKTPEEAPAALGEALKLEGDRLSFLINALDVVGTKLNDLKRVVVYSLAEGEKAPAKAVQKGDHYYLVEYFPSLNPPKPSRHAGKDRTRDRKKGKRRGRKRDFQPSEERPSTGENLAGEKQRPPRRERRPRRAPVQAQAPSGKPPVIIPKKPIPPKVPAEQVGQIEQKKTETAPESKTD